MCIARTNDAHATACLPNAPRSAQQQSLLLRQTHLDAHLDADHLEQAQLAFAGREGREGLQNN